MDGLHKYGVEDRKVNAQENLLNDPFLLKFKNGQKNSMGMGSEGRRRELWGWARAIS